MLSADCLNACSRDWISILDTATTKHQLCVKENLFISWLKPTNKHTNKTHTNASFLYPFDFSFVSFVSLYYILFYCHNPFQTF